jgi:Family of unknown function (DUF6459)
LTLGPVVSPPQHTGFAVVPVVDYEPPARNVPQCRPESPPAAQRHAPRAVRRPHDRQAGAAPIMSPSMRQAAVFADAALRRVLEVIDRRRPVSQLRPLLASGLVESVLPAGRALDTSPGAAVLRRMRLQPVGCPQTAAEVFGSYSRGERIHAIACRVEQRGHNRWLMVALHLG